MFNIKKLFLSYCLPVIIIVSFISYLTYSFLHYRSQSNDIIYFPPNVSTWYIAKKLEEARIINDNKVFVFFVYLIKLDKRTIKSGEYAFFPGERMLDVLKKMVVGNFYIRKVTIPEGLTNYQTNAILNKATVLKTDEPLNTSLDEKFDEGYLMPDTYHYHYNDSKRMILDKMYKATINFLEAHKGENKNPDILCVQEYSDLEKTQFSDYKYKQVFKEGKNIIVGNAIFSKYKIYIYFPAKDSLFLSLHFLVFTSIAFIILSFGLL